jgi:hypothetical protein
MRRRNLLIGIGVLSAGGAAAFGTEAFTSVEAERDVDVAVAGDASAYLAIQPADSANADAYVDDGGDTVAIDLDGDGKDGVEGVNQNARTEVDGLLTVTNRGTQPVAVYVEDGGSQAVTFRTANGSIEGASNSVRLSVGESTTLGLTVDTVNNDVSGSLVDSVTLVATANDPTAISAPSVSSFDYVVGPDGDYDTVSGALSAAESGETVGIQPEGGPYVPSSQIGVDVSGVTVAGKGGRPTIRNESLTANSGDDVIQVTASDVTIQTLEVVSAPGVTSNNTAPKEISLEAGADGATVVDNVTRRPDGSDGTNADGTPSIGAVGGVSDVEIRGNTLEGGPIAFNDATGSVVGNSVSSVQTEGFFAFGYGDAPELTVQNNIVEDHDRSGEGKRELKITTRPSSLNGATDGDAQFRALLADNDVNTVRIAGSGGVTVDDAGGGNRYTDIQTAIGEAGTDGFVRVRNGTYAGFQVPASGVTVESVAGVRPTVDASVGVAQSSRIVNVKSAGLTLRGFEVVGTATSLESGETGVTVPSTGAVVEDVLVRNAKTGVQFSTGSSDNTARFVTVEDAQVGISPAGGSGHLVERCDFTGLVADDYDKAPEGLGVAGGVTSRENNYGEDVFLRSYDASVSVVSDGDFFGRSGEDGEVVNTSGDTSNVTVQSVSTTANDAGVR